MMQPVSPQLIGLSEREVQANGDDDHYQYQCQNHQALDSASPPTHFCSLVSFFAKAVNESTPSMNQPIQSVCNVAKPPTTSKLFDAQPQLNAI